MKTNFVNLFYLLLQGMSSHVVSARKSVVDNWHEGKNGLTRSFRTRRFQWGKVTSALTTEEDSWLDAQQFGWTPIYGKKSAGYYGKKGSGYHGGDDDDDDPSMPTVMISHKPTVVSGPSKPTPAHPTPAPTTIPIPDTPTHFPNMMPTLTPAPTSCPPNTVQATSPGFGAQDPSRYNIWLDLDLSSDTVLSFYNNARTIWESIITGDTGDPIDIVVPPELVGPAGVPNPVDDIYISGVETCIDGPGGVLGQAGPEVIRSTNGLPVSGSMKFDIDDIPFLGASLEDVILHEMGHVFGIGSRWVPLLSDDLREYVGANGLRVWQMTFGCPGSPLIEDGGGFGTAFAHWEEDTTDPELMTGFLNSDVNNPLSELSIAVLQDLGYAVDYAPAEPFCPPADVGCTCTGSILTAGQERPPLSSEGLAAAQAYGFSALQEAAESCAAIDCNVSLQSEGLTFVGDKLVVVLYQENDYIYEVFV